METLASTIIHETLDALLERVPLVEEHGENDGPFMLLSSPAFGEVGSFRQWRGDSTVQRLVYTGISIDAIGIDSHMLFAFTTPESLVPTFTLDSVCTRMPPGADPNFPDGGDMYSFHLDLVPRCDLGINHSYIKRVYEGLTEKQAEVLASEGVYAAQLTPTQRAIMSPWMLAQRTTSAAYEAVVFSAASFYLDHWLSLVDDGLDELTPSVNGDFGRDRDALSKGLIFNRDIDAVWAKIDQLLGESVSEAMIAELRRQ